MDARDAEEFYGSRLGGLAAALLRRNLLATWPDCRGRSVLGLGYAGPYLRLWRDGSARCIALAPQQIGSSPWPMGRAGLACTAAEDALPFEDLSFDRILLVHGLEQAENARRTLREAWRVLKDNGQIIVVVPNRRGWWAYAENTPFGQGQPYSPGQLSRLLGSLSFEVESQDYALFAPPLDWPLNLWAFEGWERLGRALAPQLGGLTVVRAGKTTLAVMPLLQTAVARPVRVGSPV